MVKSLNRSFFSFFLISLVLFNGFLASTWKDKGEFDTVDFLVKSNLKDRWGISICSTEVGKEMDSKMPVQSIQISGSIGDVITTELDTSPKTTRSFIEVLVVFGDYKDVFLKVTRSTYDKPPEFFG